MKSHHMLALLPLAIGLVNEGARSFRAAPAAAPAATAAAAKESGGATKEFSIPLSNLQKWAKSVVVSIDNVAIDGSSGVHGLVDDCEIHFGGHAVSEFDGDPNGLVLEPMNACVQDPPEGFASWPAFAKSIQKNPITAAGVPRIWPEHLNGGKPSDPDHAVELHPLTQVISAGSTFDFGPNIFAGGYHGKDGNRTVAAKVAVQVSLDQEIVSITFRPGSIGNFTTLDLEIDRASITSDGSGSFRMSGTAASEDSSVPVRIVTVAGSAVNSTMAKVKKRTGKTEKMPGALVLYSLSPQALLDAAGKSHGKAVSVDQPIQLILYGVPDPE
jgi:hypothetical protein